MTPIDAALGLAFLDIKVACEIVVFCLFGDLSKRAQSNWDTTVLGPSASAEGNKTNMGAGEIDPGGIGRGLEIRRVLKTRSGKIGGLLESAAGENDYAIEPCTRERDRQETVKPGASGFP
ncbi:MAG TPA: hypothetical protein VGP28_07005 [Methylocella sp.]|nr:hypothetical protein [Methylocella sp.]